MEIEGRGGGAGVKKGVRARVRAREIVTSQTSQSSWLRSSRDTLSPIISIEIDKLNMIAGRLKSIFFEVV